MLLFQTTIRPQTNGHKSKHAHAHHEILIVETGSGHQVIGSDQEPCKAGDLYIFPAGIMHMSHTEGKEQFTCLVLNIAPNDLPELGNSRAGAAILAQVIAGCPEGGRLQIRPAVVQQSLVLLRRACQEIAQGQIGAQNLAQALIMETLVTLARALGSKPERRLGFEAAKNHIDLAIRWLEEYWMMPVKISDLVALGPLGRSQFLKHFQLRTGTSVGAYVIQKRLGAAQRMLQEKSMNILEVALACGFGSQSHFNHLFRQHTGQCPRAWLACFPRIHSAGQPAPQGDYCGPARAGFCCQGLKDRIRDPAPDTPISFLPNNAFLSRKCAHSWGGMKYFAPMSDLSLALEQHLVERGAAQVGFADLSILDPTVRKGFPIGVAFLATFPPEVIARNVAGPTPEYAQARRELDQLLAELRKEAASFLIARGYRADTDLGPVDRTCFRSPLPLKTVATLSGLGWIGRSALLVSERYGSAFRLGAVLTDAPLPPSQAITESRCGSCRICVEVCPAGAPLGPLWQQKLEREQFFNYAACKETAYRLTKERIVEPNDTIAHCGICLANCRFTKRWIKNAGIS